MLSCVLLTAGESQRFGSPKALADIHQTKAIELLQQKLLQSSVGEIIIVTGAHEALIKSYVFNHSKVRVVHNKDYKLGQTSSFQKGVAATDSSSEGFMLLPVDCPFVLTQTINELTQHFQQCPSSILIPTYQQRRGHPPVFRRQLKEEILRLDVNKGVSSLMGTHPSETIEINDPGIVQTFNTPEELTRYLK